MNRSRTATLATAIAIVALGSGLVATPLAASSAGPEKNGRIAFLTMAGEDQLIASINPDGSGRKILARCTKDTGRCTFGRYAWSPDGKRFAYLRGDPGCCPTTFRRRSNRSLYVVGADGRGERRLAGCVTTRLSCGDFSWAPDSSRIVFSRRGSLYVVDTRSGGPRRITSCPVCRDVEPSWSPDGSKIVFGTQVGSKPRLYVLNPDGSGLEKLADGGNPSWSPDGRRIAFDGGDGVYTVNVDGSNRMLLVSEKGGEGPGFPSWSPDGTRIAFVRTPGRPGGFSAEVWTMRADGSDQKRLYRSACCIGGPPAATWSPDGHRIAISFFGPPKLLGLFLMQADGTRFRRVTPEGAFSEVAWQSLSTQRRNR
jgi:Tol biopolymer transport system component